MPVETPTEITLRQLFELYLELHAKPHTKRWDDTVMRFETHLKCFADRPTSSITRIEVQNWLNNIGKTGKHSANRNYDVLRAIMSWGIKKEVINHRNPCLGVDRFRLKPRERFVLPGDEFERLANAINAESNTTLRDFFWMCLMTGARRGNILHMRWDEINLEVATWVIPETKNGDSQTVPLIAEAIILLDKRRNLSTSEWVFPNPKTNAPFKSPKAAWNRIRRRANLPDLRIHDLRRTVGSYMAIRGVSSTIIGKALGHRSQASTAVYARLTQNPVREAVANAMGPMLDNALKQGATTSGDGTGEYPNT